jgi:hypothetical protein
MAAARPGHVLLDLVRDPAHVAEPGDVMSPGRSTKRAPGIWPDIHPRRHGNKGVVGAMNDHGRPCPLER